MRRSTATFLLVALLAPLSLAGCGTGRDSERDGEASGGPPVVAVRAVGDSFAAPDSLRSGWTTIMLNNRQGKRVHQLTLSRLPGGRTFEDYTQQVVPGYDSIFALVESGGMAGSGQLEAGDEPLFPAWASAITTVTDQGLLSPGRSARKTVYLEPGTYVLRCLVRAEDGSPHFLKGEISKLTVTKDSTGASPPEADLEIEVSGGEMVTPDTISAGTRTVAAQLGMGERHNTVHLLRTHEGADRDEVVRWLAVWRPGVRQAPAPAEFLGGSSVVGSGRGGNRAYFTIADLQPGQYTWVVSGRRGKPGNAIWKPVTVE